MMRAQTKTGLAVLLAVGLLAAPLAARAQGPRQGFDARGPELPARASRTFGTASSTSHTIQAFAFNGLTAADSARFSANLAGSRFCTASPCLFEAAVSLPAGALVTAIELEACDTDAGAAVLATLFRATPLESSLAPIAAVSTGPAGATPDCAFFLSALGTPETIDNFNNTYQMEVAIDGASEATRFQAVRIYYNLQVSPAPATASFADVSIFHPFFRFIEALRAAGITTGCGDAPPRYCPDDPLTRGQMAVFLSKALGLHFVP